MVWSCAVPDRARISLADPSSRPVNASITSTIRDRVRPEVPNEERIEWSRCAHELVAGTGVAVGPENPRPSTSATAPREVSRSMTRSPRYRHARPFMRPYAQVAAEPGTSRNRSSW